MAENDEKQPIIIKRIKKSGGGHHGGAWKVAYADFVTAMMAFFLLLWLLNVTTDEQKAYISSYFAPADPRIAESLSGAGGVMGGTTLSPEGAMSSNQSSSVYKQQPSQGTGAEEGEGGDNAAEEQAEMVKLDAQDEEAFGSIEEQIRQALESVPELKALSQHLIVDMTPEGLRIQIIDQKGKPMFELGKATPLPHTITLLGLVVQTIQNMPNKISVRGHTDAIPYGTGATYTNWELSSDRANAARRVMLDKGMSAERLHNVQGRAAQELLVKDNPESPRNRRISIILLKQSLVKGLEKKVKKKVKTKKLSGPEKRKREEGVIYFP